MDKQDLFILANPMLEPRLYTDDDRFLADTSGIVLAYIFAMVMEELCPVWFSNPKHKQAVKEMKQAFRNYRKTNDLDAELQKAIKNSTVFDNPHLFEQLKDNPVICVEDMALITSPDPKDKRFVLRTMKGYFKKAFPDFKQVRKARTDQTTNSRKAFNRPTTVLEKRTLTDISSVFPTAADLCFKHPSLGPLDKNKRLDGDSLTMFHQMCRYAMILMGHNSDFFETEDDDLVEKEYWDIRSDENGDLCLSLSHRRAAELACLNPTLDACLVSSDLFQPILTQVYMLRKVGMSTDILTKQNDSQVQMLRSIAESVVLPMMTEIKGLTANTKSIQDGAEKAKAELEQRIESISQDLVKASVQAVDTQEISALKTAISDTERELQAARETASRLEKELEKALIYNQKIEACLAESNSRYNALNEQLIDFLEEGGIFIEEDEVSELADLSKNPSGIRERIGEIAYQKLLNKRVMVVGGHANTYAALSNLFPNWEYYPDDSVLRDTVWAVDAIACITTYVPHRSFIYARDRARSKGIQFIPVPHNGPATICKHLATHIVDDVAVA